MAGGSFIIFLVLSRLDVHWLIDNKIDAFCGRSGQPKKNWANVSDETNKKLRRVTWKDIEVG